MNHPSAFLSLAIQAALKSGELLKKGFGTRYQVSSKEGKQNLVTEYDKASEESIILTVQNHFPDHSFLAEETGSSGPSDSSVTWIIDPLDGTVNFAHHIPIFSISIAVAVEKRLLCGVVYQPMLNELFVAEKGKGAYLNGVPLRVSRCSQWDEAIMATGFPYNVDQNPLHCIDHFVELAKLGIPIRRLGSAAIDLAYVAAGRFDAYWEVSLHPWDMAAGKLLVEEAGGRVSHYDGSDHRIFCHETLLATNGALHQTMVEKLGRAR
jgi:myo-inositol-1(or 4)-monophosphatase